VTLAGAALVLVLLVFELAYVKAHDGKFHPAATVLALLAALVVLLAAAYAPGALTAHVDGQPAPRPRGGRNGDQEASQVRP
jgi:heme A synthase